MCYSIIIPIYNELNYLPILLDDIKKYSYNNEIIIVNDGSNDGSKELLEKCNFILLINLKNNCGKAVAVRKGLGVSKFEKIIIFDGDLEISPNELNKIMILNKNNDIISVFGNRNIKRLSFFNYWYFGNYFFSKLFNLFFKTTLNDVLCCAKSFYKKDLNVNMLRSKSFDIDVEIAALLSINNKINEVHLNYNRRSKKEGKKLTIFSSGVIFYRILFIFMSHSLLAPFKRMFETALKK